MTIKYEIRQEVRTVIGCRLEPVFITPTERLAELSYASLVAANPGEYFELLKIEHSETCLALTARIES